MNFDVALILGLLNLLLLIGLFIWLLMGSPARILRGMLSKEEQMLQQAALLNQLSQGNERLERELRQELASNAQSSRLEMGQTLAGMQGNVQQSLAGFQGNLTTQLTNISEGNARRLTEVRETLDAQLTRVREALNQQLEQLGAKNEAKLDEMRRTVDEKLQTTLETRLGESFKQVADRLEQVHKGLGEMQTLAAGVGDLKHLLTNVKTRGTFGEAQLGALLEQVFVAEQFAAQIATVPGSRNVVDYAIRLPGRSDDGSPTWLPIDSKFPTEDYERLLDAQERADPVAAEVAAKALEARIRLEAKSMAEKYVAPPHTTDFAILFLPSEGLYAEVLRRPGLMDALQRDHRVTLAGPTTLLAMLNSLQMGFRTLALEQRSSEVWQVLGAVKTEFGKFGEFVSKVRAQADSVVKTLDQAQTRTNMMNRALKKVEALPEAQAQNLLPLDKADDEG
ncbi:DNA recombination protein RmuC [Variovorax sp. PCZ-1]|uniref:DNA recombination protein RmuC n=1 Tax=Variovorax sp. PCZ-1 TaxID=2835533 RepID=UPI001BCC81ED|nr:DNA recombination protein RmuC [Variovorax sp. PCZ-1]MBS7808298.1 DNA recombination protein RmuC [Variovorax sp. PCZ-1]